MKNNVIAVVGPTASGKTALSVNLAEQFDGEVVSFDSMQLYRGMDIATAKPTKEEMHGVPHHLLDCIDPSETFSVARYQSMAQPVVDDILRRDRVPVLVGGTGLYLDALLQNIQFLDAGDNSAVRRELQEELERSGPDAMYQQLQKIDPEYAGKITPANTRRVLRALEVYRLTGYTMSYQIALSKRFPPRYQAVTLGLTARDRDVLYERINRRVDRMVEQGLLDEARECLAQGSGATAAQAIGIKEMFPYLLGNATLDECCEKLKTDTRHYAKRQLTWFRRNPDVHWLYIDEYSSPEELFSAAAGLIRKEWEKTLE